MMDAKERREALRLLLEEFAESYAQKKGAVSLNGWLSEQLREHLPEKSAKEVDAISSDILSSLAIQEEKKGSLEDFTAQGRSKESWFASELKKDTAGMSEDERNEVLSSVYGAASKNQADVLNLVKDTDADAVTPEVLPPVTNDYQAGEAARAAGRKIADNATINIIISSEAIEVMSRNRRNVHSAVIEEEFTSSNTSGLKAASAGAVYTGAELGLIDMPEDDRPVLSAAAAFQGVETAEILSRKLPLEDTVNRLERTGVSVCSGIMSAVKGAQKGAAAGAKLGSALGWIGSAAGSFLGGIVGGVAGYFSGSRTSDAIISSVQKVKPRAIERAASVVKTVAKAAWEGVKSVGRAVLSFFGF